jgi:hypothetical protein
MKRSNLIIFGQYISRQQIHEVYLSLLYIKVIMPLTTNTTLALRPSHLAYICIQPNAI